MTASEERCARCGHDRLPRKGRNGHAECICHGHGIAGYLPGQSINDYGKRQWTPGLEPRGNGPCVVERCHCPAFVPANPEKKGVEG